MLKRWDRFARFVDDGRICLTNNAAERALRGFALGRKSWLFAGSDRGAERAAVMATLIMTPSSTTSIRRRGLRTCSRASPTTLRHGFMNCCHGIGAPAAQERNIRNAAGLANYAAVLTGGLQSSKSSDVKFGLCVNNAHHNLQAQTLTTRSSFRAFC